MLTVRLALKELLTLADLVTGGARIRLPRSGHLATARPICSSRSPRRLSFSRSGCSSASCSAAAGPL